MLLYCILLIYRIPLANVLCCSAGPNFQLVLLCFHLMSVLMFKSYRSGLRRCNAQRNDSNKVLSTVSAPSDNRDLCFSASVHKYIVCLCCFIWKRQRNKVLYRVKVKKKEGKKPYKCWLAPVCRPAWQPCPCLGHPLRLGLLILLLFPYACQHGWPFVISNLQAGTTLHRSLFGGGGSVVVAAGEVLTNMLFLIILSKNSVNRF